MEIERAKFFFLVAAIATAAACDAAPPTASESDLVGGRPAKVSLPSTVNIFGTCSSAKIGERHLLLAGHCISDPVDGNAIAPGFARGSTIYVTNSPIPVDPYAASGPTEEGGPTVEGGPTLEGGPTTEGASNFDDYYAERGYRPVEIESAIMHSSWKGVDPQSTFAALETASDVAIVVLSKSSAQAIADVPIAKIDTSEVRVGDELVIGGFGCERGLGTVEPNARLKVQRTATVSPEVLHETTVSGINTGEVSARYFVTPGRILDKKSASLCSGDSGGPVYRANSNDRIVGINSHVAMSLENLDVSYANVHARVDTKSNGNIAKWIADVLKR